MDHERDMQLKPSGHPRQAGTGRDIGSLAHLNIRTDVAMAFALLMAVVAVASTRPHYGSTAHVLLQAKVSTLDPLAESEYPDERDKLSKLIFETLTEIDSQGHLQPKLASSWRSDSGDRVWQFQLRLANFQDGTAVTAAGVVASLKSVSPDWKASATNRQAITIETPVPSPHLPELLSLEKFAIVKRLPDNTLVGTGAYKPTQWQAGEHAVFSANDDYWEGRPYPDAIEVEMGASLRDHLLERSLGRDHAAQLGIDQARALEQTSQNVIVSRPAELVVMVFAESEHGSPGNRRKPVDPHIRAAISYALDRAAISNLLLQRKAAPATGLLPQWLTGYEFMFAGKGDAEQERKAASAASPVELAYDFSDPVSKIIAERIALDAHEAGIVMQPYADTHIKTKAARKGSNADAALVRLPLPALAPAPALAGLADDLDLSPETLSSILSAVRPDDLFTAERKILENHRIIPVVHLSQVLWLNSTVHNWQQLPDGEWNLDQMWVEK
jgi:peptide/nickel transport system substrate-binding protein